MGLPLRIILLSLITTVFSKKRLNIENTGNGLTSLSPAVSGLFDKLQKR